MRRCLSIATTSNNAFSNPTTRHWDRLTRAPTSPTTGGCRRRYVPSIWPAHDRPSPSTATNLCRVPCLTSIRSSTLARRKLLASGTSDSVRRGASRNISRVRRRPTTTSGANARVCTRSSRCGTTGAKVSCCCKQATCTQQTTVYLH